MVPKVPRLFASTEDTDWAGGCGLCGDELLTVEAEWPAAALLAVWADED
jgi:hypothetical protein